MDPMPDTNYDFKALGSKVTKGYLEAVPLSDDARRRIGTVRFTSDEVTSSCPVTGQPDFYTVSILIAPARHSIESKSLKLYLQHFKDTQQFAEELASTICGDINQVCLPRECYVEVEQKSRGGITLIARAELPNVHS